MSNTEETNKLSAEEHLIDQFGDEEQFLLYSQEFPIWQTLMKTMESFASMRVEQEKEDEKERMIQFLTKCTNACDEQIERFVNSGMDELTGGSAAMKCAYQVILNELNNVK